MQLGEAAGGGIGEAEEAVEAFGRAAALRPGKGAAGALANRGMLLRRLGRSGEAVEAFGRAVELEGSGETAGGILRELAMALLEEKRFAEAEETAARATEAARGNGEWAQESEAWRSLGIIRGARGDRAGGLAAYEKALAIAKRAELAVPEDWRIEKEVLEERAGSGRTRLPEEFVRRLFDGYALRFEKHLVGELGYRMPALLAEAVAQARGEGGGQVVVDLGCGTGLCGEAFVEFARGPGGRLVGVDLSGVMVERARSRKIYEELIVGEIGEAMRKMPEGSVDLLVAGDVFIYVGELAAIFAEARRVLRRGGLLAFSVERPAGEGSAEGLQFTGGGRFAHSEGYLRQRAAAAGLEVVMVREAFLRGDVGNGSIVLLRRPVSG
jgi:predicted TPR repeat methyltransferase